MGLVKKAGGSKVPAGEKLRFRINRAVEDEGNAKLLDSLESIEDLVDALVGKSFVSITKPRGKSGDYTGITWDMVYVDQQASKKKPPAQQNDEDFDDLPFGDDDPPPAF